MARASVTKNCVLFIEDANKERKVTKMAIHSKNYKQTTTRRTIHGTGNKKPSVPMARASDVPPGKYRSRIVSVRDTKTLSGAEALEVIYELTAPDGSVRKMREVIPDNSWAFGRFSDALIAAGLDDDGDIADAVGVTEDVVLTYPDPHGLGHFSKRTPAVANSAPRAPADDEDDPAPGFDDDDDAGDDWIIDDD